MRELLYLVGPTPKIDESARWFERDEGDQRLQQDRALIRYDYPGLRFGMNWRRKEIFLYGTITLRAECRIPTHIPTRVIFSDAYPTIEPIAYETTNVFPHIPDRHFYKDGGCCLWLPVESQWKPHDPTGLHGFLDQVATFYERQLIYDASPEKSWPWGQRGHGITGYIELVQEMLGEDSSVVTNFLGVLSGKEIIARNSNCPCGRRKKFRLCHANTCAKILAKLGRHNPFPAKERRTASSI